MLLLNAIVVMAAPEHFVWLDGVAAALGVGFTVIVNVCDVPVHPLATGVTVIVAVTIVVPPFVAVNAAMSPVPLAANPILVVLFVQLNVVPDTVPVKFTAV